MGGCGTLISYSGVKSMFMGEYQHTIDTKGRLIVPSKFREHLGDGFVLTRGLDNCLFGYPMDEWKRLEEKLKLCLLRKKMHVHLPVFSFPVQRKLNWTSKDASIFHHRCYNMQKLKRIVSLLGFQDVLKYGQNHYGMPITMNPNNHSMKSQKILLTLIFKQQSKGSGRFQCLTTLQYYFTKPSKVWI